ncbi:hypothetical protein [Halopseudomonas laoshanensis]|uniref:hypothetical protein n=1 Tax=Halopseudomonas laoshanensis TaxID=2268758 RepID=UPI0037363CE9
MPAASMIRSALATAAILIFAWAPASAATFTAQYVSPPVPGQSAGTLPPGLYVAVTTGAIILSNSGGSQSFSSGQFGFTNIATTPPIVVPANPGLKFSPPPSFVTVLQPTTGTDLNPTTGSVDCEVR